MYSLSRLISYFYLFAFEVSERSCHSQTTQHSSEYDEAALRFDPVLLVLSASLVVNRHVECFTISSQN